jgi:hypothetical protein
MLPGPQEHCAPQAARKRLAPAHQTNTTGLCESDNLFLDNSITQAKDERTAIANNNTNNAKHMAIDFAHAQRDQPTIGLAQRGQNMVYHLGAASIEPSKSLPS